MNRNKFLQNLEHKNRRNLLNLYISYEKKLLNLIFEATFKGNNTDYLESLRADVKRQIALMKKDLKRYSVKTSKETATSGIKFADYNTKQLSIFAGYQASKINFGRINTIAFQKYAEVLANPLGDLAQKIGRATLEFMKRENFKTSEKTLKALGNFIDNKTLAKMNFEGVQDIVAGSISYGKGARQLRDEFIKKGSIKIPYYNKKGDVTRKVEAKTYAKMVARTTTANIMREATKDRILDTFNEGDLVEILGESEFEDSPCIPFQGEILSLTGATEGYITIDEAKEEGLFHPNCIHAYAVTDKVMKEYAKKDSLKEIRERLLSEREQK